MSEGVLTILKLCLMALLYLFVARVVWVVSSELRATPMLGTTSERDASRGAVPGAARSSTRSRRRGPWRLTVVEPETARGTVYEVDGELTIGRAGGCGIPLPDDTYSSNLHARVFEQDGHAWVEDLGSTNGTFVGRARLAEPHRLGKGERVQVGSTVFEVSR